MRRRPSALRLAAAMLGAAAVACGHTVLDVPPARTPEEAWAEHFERAERFQRAGYYEQAQDQLELALEAAQALPLESGREVETRRALANLHRLFGRATEVERQYLAVLELERRLHGPRSEAAASALNDLGILYSEADRLEDAARVLVEAVEVRNELYGSLDPRTAVPTQNLAEIYRRLGETLQAEVLFQRALAGYEAGGREYYGAAAIAQNQLAQLFAETEREQAAERLHLNAIRLAARGGGESPELARFSRDLADLYTRESRFGEAEPLYREALALFERFLGPQHPEVRLTLVRLAAMLVAAGRSAEAVGFYRRAAEMAPGPGS